MIFFWVDSTSFRENKFVMMSGSLAKECSKRRKYAKVCWSKLLEHSITRVTVIHKILSRMQKSILLNFFSFLTHYYFSFFTLRRGLQMLNFNTYYQKKNKMKLGSINTSLYVFYITLWKRKNGREAATGLTSD